MRIAHPRVSFTDLEQWPEDGRRYELYDGEVYVVPSPMPLHQTAAAQIQRVLLDYALEHGGLVFHAPLDIVLTEFDVVQPDVLFFTGARARLVNPRAVTRHPPDLAIEILSPSTAGNDRGRKMQLLAEHGVREFWLVDPVEVTIEVYWLNDGQYALACRAAGDESVLSPLLPDLQLIANDITRLTGRIQDDNEQIE
jgi:Uma2 family endonuclease